MVANRDEFYERKTTPADFWKDHEKVLAGRDLEAGGTWMGVNKHGLLSMLTNYRDLQNIRQDAPSRGHLVSDFLIHKPQPESYLKNIEEKGHVYNGFNIICGNAEKLYYYGNYQKGVHEIDNGIHGLSNALLNTPWPKVVRGREKLKHHVERDMLDHGSLFELLFDDLKAGVEELPETGVGLEKEKMLSPMFIKSPNYGSRCSTVLMVDAEGNHTYAERTYNINDFSYSDRLFQFTIN